MAVEQERRLRALWLLAILAVTLAAYAPAFRAHLTNWDDPAFVTANPLIQELTPASVRRIFSEVYWAAYAPLTLLSLAVEHALVGDRPWLYHATNVALHLVATGLVFWWVLLLAGRSDVAIATALLFGVHPLHVESVAWVSERRDVLYGALFVAALIAYQRHLRSPSVGRYLTSLGFFLLAILAKGVAVSLAPTLVAVDLLSGRKLSERRVLAEKAPFFALALLFGAVAVYAERVPGGIANSAGSRLFSLGERLLLACSGFAHYLLKLAAPVGLSAFYPYPDKVGGALPAHYWLYPLAPLAVGLLIVLLARRWPVVAFGLAFFGLNVALVLQVLPYANFVMADRYVYVPSIGIFLAVAALLVRLAEQGPGVRRALLFAGVACATLFAALTFSRCRVWHDSLSLWNDVLARYPTVWEAWDNRGSARAEQGDLAGAIADHSRAIQLEPRAPGTWYNRGNARVRAGDLERAIADYDAALRLRPDNPDAARNRAVAVELLRRARQGGGSPQPAPPPAGAAPADPRGTAQAYAARAALRVARGDDRGALGDCDRALALDPELVEAWVTRGAALHNLGRLEPALDALDHAIQLDPGNVKALFNRGMVRLRAGQREAGCADLAQARRLGLQEAQAAFDRFCSG
jgi:tetratricopeptide (TPR) repeat protein